MLLNNINSSNIFQIGFHSTSLPNGNCINCSTSTSSSFRMGFFCSWNYNLLCKISQFASFALLSRLLMHFFYILLCTSLHLCIHKSCVKCLIHWGIAHLNITMKDGGLSWEHLRFISAVLRKYLFCRPFMNHIFFDWLFYSWKSSNPFSSFRWEKNGVKIT